ncbi:MAG: energy transducer TonB [Roseobacter sp.]
MAATRLQRRIGRRKVHTGHKISGAAHVLLLGWMAFGDVFAAEPLPLQSTDVSVISGAAFDAMVAGTQAPTSVTEVAQPAAPDTATDVPDVPTTTEDQTSLTQPAPAETPDAETPPDVSQIAPLPRADISDQAPVLDQPEADIAVLVPEISDTPVPQASERVAPEAVAPPDPEAAPDPVEQAAIAPDTSGESQEDPTEATAPEAAATEIVTEAEQPARPLERSLRPPARRPQAPVQAAAPAPEVENPSDTVPAAENTTDDAVAAALEEALTGAQETPSVPQGPPLSAGEKETLRVAVSSCWNVGSLSTDALGTTVVVNVAMTQDGKPVNGSIRLASSSGGSEAAARQAFEAARRAIIRCGARGFDLPVEKYSQWQEIEMTFNPERMRVK